MENVRRIYVEKKTGYAVKAQELKEDLIGYLNMSGIEDVRMFIRYDVENISDEVFEQACRTVFFRAARGYSVSRDDRNPCKRTRIQR